MAALITTPYRIFRTDGTAEEEFISWPKEPGYKEIAKLIVPILDGAELEHVTVLHEGKRADMFVDEMGRMKPLARNERATSIYRTNWMTKHPSVDPETLPWIAGTAVLFLRRIWF